MISPPRCRAGNVKPCSLAEARPVVLRPLAPGDAALVQASAPQPAAATLARRASAGSNCALTSA